MNWKFSVRKKILGKKIQEHAKKIDKIFSKEITGLKMKEAEQDKKIKNQNNKIGFYYPFTIILIFIHKN